MESKPKESYNDALKIQTLQIQQLFLSQVNNEISKWLCLKEYKSAVLLEESFNRTVVASYVSVLSTLLDSLKPTLFTQKWQEQLYDEIFLQGIQHEAFMILIKRLDEKNMFEQKKIIGLLQKFLQGSSIESLLLYQCYSHDNWDLKYVSKSNIWDELITSIISLPERIANSTKGQFIKIFNLQFYIPLLLSSVLKVLSHIHVRIKNEKDSSVEFLAKLIGRMCTTGYADLVAKKVSSELIKVSEFDFIWRRISQNFVSKMPSNCIASFITNLLLVVPWYGYVEWIIGDAGVKNEKINDIMTVKLIFIRIFKSNMILQNIIGYFASSKDRISQFSKILNSLLDSWIDQRALHHQSIEQKTYIAAALMICAGWVKKMKSNFDSKANINKILKGTQLRLESSEESVRALGMIVGENLISSFDPDAPSLKFEFTDVDQLNHLKSLLDIPEKPKDSTLLFEEDLKCFDEVEIEKQKWESAVTEETNIPPDSNTELDSDDDDLEPYDLSNNVPKTEHKRPLYIRDCMKGLMDPENGEYVEQCLKHAEDLIKNNSYAAQEVSEEMTKIVLHLDDSFSIPDFLAYRHRVLIALTVQCPLTVANYLASQFSVRDYNIRQRLDILEVLAASSVLLSHSNIALPGIEPNISKDKFIAKREESWKLIASQSLEAKTRRFSKTPKQELVLKENKFSAIAGNFFYPLLNSCDKGNKTLKLFEENKYLLGRLIYTLGIIMVSASNSLNCQQIATTLLQFLASVRNQSDVFVRQSVIFAIAAAYMGVPPSILLTDMLPEVLDTNEWLQSIAMNDPESGCVEKAIYTLSIFQGLAAEGPLLPQKLKSLINPR